MLSRSLLSCLLLLPGFLSLSSCRSPVPIWNQDGRTMTDLRTLRHHAKQSVALTTGVTLYADEIHYADKRKRAGEAVGHVLLEIATGVRYEWMIERGYAGKAVFDKRRKFVALADQPMLEREYMTQIATEPYTTIEIRWTSRLAEVVVSGPTRTDFSKSHPVPPGVVIPQGPLPPVTAPARRPLSPMGHSKW